MIHLDSAEMACSRFPTGPALGSVLPLYLTTFNLCYFFYVFFKMFQNMQSNALPLSYTP